MVGSLGYTWIELIWRGHTHWTMAVAGGVCLSIVYFMNNQIKAPLFVKCIFSCITITEVEFIIGCIVNIFLKWSVWDYSNIPFNFLGQICLLYSFFWLLLSVPMIKLCEIIDKPLQNLIL